MASLPLQPPEAVHKVALVELQASVEVPPLAMTEGVATKVAVGMILTRTLDTLLVPPVPVQVKEYELGIVMAPVLCVPLVALLPPQPPDAVHEVAFVELQVSVDAVPLAIEVGAAPRDAVGFGLLAGLACLEPHAASSSDATRSTLRKGNLHGALNRNPCCFGRNKTLSRIAGTRDLTIISLRTHYKTARFSDVQLKSTPRRGARLAASMCVA